MTYYDSPSWQAPARQASWDQAAPPSRSGASSAMPRDDGSAFTSQFEEVDRALDNLSKSGKAFPMPGRRESGPMGGAGPIGGAGPMGTAGPMGGAGPIGGTGRGFGEFGDPRVGGPSRNSSVDFDPSRAPSANAQSFYSNQRFQPRHSEADQMQQAKRRMAAQRERELRNYHQEQQYNRNVSTQGKSDRSNSPSIQNEDDRRDLIARQHRALYGNEGQFENGGFGEDGHTPRPASQATAPSSARGHSPMAFNNFIAQETSADNTAKGPSPKPSGTRSRSNSNSSPASNTNPQSFSLFDSANAQQSSRTSTSSPGTSPPRQGKTSAPAPIGTRPTNPALSKHTTPPASSPLSFGFAPNEAGAQGERAGSAASNPAHGSKENNGNNANWGNSSGVWGKSTLGGVQASVWG